MEPDLSKHVTQRADDDFDLLSRPPCPLAPGKRNVSITRAIVIAWNRVTHALRRSSQRGIPTGFTLIIPYSTREPYSSSGGALPPSAYADTGSEWSLV
jgi:hypothetical protein